MARQGHCTDRRCGVKLPIRGERPPDPACAAANTGERKRRAVRNARPRHNVGRRTRDTRPQSLPIRHSLRCWYFKSGVGIFYSPPNPLTDSPRKLLISNGYQHVARGLLT